MSIATRTNKLKILFVTRAYGANAGGMERLSWELTLAVRKSGLAEVRVVAHQGPRWLAPLFVLTCLPKVLAEAGWADAVHLGDPVLAFVGWTVKIFKPKPVAVNVHGLDILYSNFLYQLYLRLFFNKLDLYLPISRAVAELLKKRSVRGKMAVINPGVTDRFFDAALSRSDLEKLLKRSNGQPGPVSEHGVNSSRNDVVLLTAGRLVKRKGHAWFVREVLPKLPANFLYVIAGTGPEFKHIQHAASDAGVADKVVMLGRVSDVDLKILYNTTDAFVQPNIKVVNDFEGFGLVLLEAALCQRLIFASNIEGMTDAIKSGKNGSLLPDQNAAAWIKALKNLSFKTALSPQAREYSLANFTWPKQTKDFIKALAKTISTS